MTSHALSRTCILALTALALLAACGRDHIADPKAVPPYAAERAQHVDAASAIAADAAPAPAPASDETMALRRRAATDLQLPTAGDSVATTSMIIRVGNAAVLVDSLEAAVAQVRLLAERLGGFLASTSMQTGPQHLRSATMTLRVPAARYDEALGGLEPIGRVETVHTSAEDVGEEFVDVQARMANARRLETRLVELLATRTGRLDDVLAVERELARVREQIDRFEGRLRYLRARASLSTLTVTVHEAAPLVGTNPSASVIGEAFVAAWRNFVSFLAGLIAALGWALPGTLVALGAVVLARRIGSRLIGRRRPLPPPETPAPVATT